MTKCFHRLSTFVLREHRNRLIFFFFFFFSGIFFFFFFFRLIYSKDPKFLDTRNCCNLPKIQTKRQNFRIFRQTDANGIANSEDPDQTAPLGAV